MNKANLMGVGEAAKPTGDYPDTTTLTSFIHKDFYVTNYRKSTRVFIKTIC